MIAVEPLLVLTLVPGSPTARYRGGSGPTWVACGGGEAQGAGRATGSGSARCSRCTPGSARPTAARWPRPPPSSSSSPCSRLILVAIAVLGFVTSNDASVTGDIIDGLGLTARPPGRCRTPSRRPRRAAGPPRSSACWACSGAGWRHHRRPDGGAHAVAAQDRGHQDQGLRLIWLLVGALTLGGAIGAGALLEPHAGGRPPSRGVTIGLILVGIALELGFFLWTFWILGDRRAGWRAFLPGAVVGALGLEVLKLVGTVLVPRMVAASSSLDGPIGIVFATCLAHHLLEADRLRLGPQRRAPRGGTTGSDHPRDSGAPVRGRGPRRGRSWRCGGRHRARRDHS